MRFLSPALFCLLAAPVFAQLPNSVLQQISPAFGKVGTTFEVSVSGENLEQLTGLRFSNPRIKAKQVRLPIDEIYPQGRPSGNGNRFTVTIPASFEPGIVEVRTLGYFGLSTARPFLVVPEGSVEIREEGDHSTRDKALPIEIETGVSGAVENRGIDWYRFPAKAGDRLLIQAWAERLDSRADLQLAVFDAAGRELESNRQFFGRDPFVDFTPETDGEYFLAVSDILYRGSSSHFYRLNISRDPHIDFAWPPAGVPGTKTKFTIYGRNLPGGSQSEGVVLDGKPLESVEVELNVPAEPGTVDRFTSTTPRQSMLSAFTHRIGNSNATRIGFATAPVVEEKPDAESQTVTVPAEIAGRFDTPGDPDVFRFSAKIGTTYFIESIADRLTTEADTVLILRKAGDETILAEADDPASFFSVDRFDSTNFDTTDAALEFTPEEDGEYEVKLINQSGGGSPAHRYRLAIREAKPDYQLFTSTERTITATNGRAGYPAAPLVRKNGTVAYRVVAPRRDGFEGDIVVRATGLPEGVTSKPLVLSGDTETGFLTVKAAANAPAWSGPIRISGRAKIGDREVVRESKNASLDWGVIFSDSFRVRSRLDLETVLSVTADETTPAFVTAEKPEWEVELGQKLEIPVKVTDFDSLRKGNLTVQPHGFPGMLRSPPNVAIAEGTADGKLTIDFNPNGNFQAKAGQFQFVLQGIGLAKYQHNPKLGLAATAEHKRLVALEAEFAKQVETAQQRLADLKKQGAGKPELDAAQQAVKTAEDLKKRAGDAVKLADKEAKAARAKAVAKDTKFATFSRPITVVVKEPAPAKK
ncbi:MAG: hypothetical protein HKN23_17910 [Verrucomicrobiales bacterium]|nr:hypothetical protein [Verrucomicrobiales bacterium]